MSGAKGRTQEQMKRAGGGEPSGEARQQPGHGDDLGPGED